MLKFSKL